MIVAGGHTLVVGAALAATRRNRRSSLSAWPFSRVRPIPAMMPRPMALLCWLLLWRGAACVTSASSRILEEVAPSAADADGGVGVGGGVGGVGESATGVDNGGGGGDSFNLPPFDAQRDALLRFASGLADPHQSLATWRSGPGHPCGAAAGARPGPWTGVDCDEPRGSVVGLDLSGRGLGGTLGASLVEIATLRSMCDFLTWTLARLFVCACMGMSGCIFSPPC